MKIKALSGFETLHHTPEEDEHGYTLRAERIEMKLGEIRDLPDKIAKRLIDLGHAEEADAAPAEDQTQSDATPQ